ncbi:hypothetical protein OIO90_000520 [Microbotryomycetes sp. JL221]|nr:hypothetical protein OIO90_000520 [Microbotryomycetes sp. JL221]
MAPAYDLDDDEWQDMPVIPPSNSSTSTSTTKSKPNKAKNPFRHRRDSDEDEMSDNEGIGRFPTKSTTQVHGSNKSSAIDDPSQAAPTPLTGRAPVGNATGKLIDFDSKGSAWREKDQVMDKEQELDYTRLELDDDPQEDEISMRTQYLFNEDKGMTPLSQMQATKTLLTEGQRIAYVGLCKLVTREMIQTLAIAAKGASELVQSRDSARAWALKIMGRLYRHMEVDSAEQRMIDQLAEHGVTAEDLVPSLLTTYTVDNPEYDPDAEAQEAEEEQERERDRQEAEQRERDDDDARERQRQLDAQRLAEDEEKERQQAEAEEDRRIQEEEKAGRVAREVAKIERRHSQALERELSLTSPPRSPRTPSRKSSRQGSLKSPSLESPIKSPTLSTGRSRFPSFDDAGDITTAYESTSRGAPLQIETAQTALEPKYDTIAESPAEAEVSPAKSKTDEPLTPRPTQRQVDEDGSNAHATPSKIGSKRDETGDGEGEDDDSLLKPMPSTLPGVSTTLSPADKTITLDIRWTILCDLWLSLIADSVYDSRSRVLLGRVAEKLGLDWMDVVRFERRLTEALELQEAVANKEHGEVLEGRAAKDKRSRYVMMGLATLGGGLVIGLSAGLLAPVIGAGLGAALTTVGVTGTTGFLAGAGGSAIIASGATLTGGMIGGKAMAKRTRHVKTFEFLPLHNNKRLNCYVAIPGFMNGLHDDVRLPFSTIDPLMGDVFSVLWEPEMMGDTGNALKILSSEVLTQAGQQVLAMTVLTALMSAIQWPMMLTKLSYLIDNPWSNALDRAKQAGAVLADILLNRRLGVRPVSLVGFSLGARVIFYALVELAKANAFGVVQEVYLFGATVTASLKKWRQVRGVVSGRFVNAFAMNDWVLGYLFRATTGGLQTVAGLRPIEHVPEIENVDVTHLLTGHMSYRPLMPALLNYVGFKVISDHFDEPEEMDPDGPDREIVTKEEEERRRLEKEKKKLGLVGRLKLKKSNQSSANGSTAGSAPMSRAASGEYDGLPPRADGAASSSTSSLPTTLGQEQHRGSSSLSISTAGSVDVSEDQTVREQDAPGESPRQVENSKPSESPTIPQSVSQSTTGVFDIEKLKEEISNLPSKVDDAGSAPQQKAPVRSKAGPPTTDLRNLDTTLDPRDLLRRQWNGEVIPPAPPPALASGFSVPDSDSPWAAPAVGRDRDTATSVSNPFATTLPSTSSMFSFDSVSSAGRDDLSRNDHVATPSFTFGSSDGGFAASSSLSNDYTSTWSTRSAQEQSNDDADDGVPDPASKFVWSNSSSSFDPNWSLSRSKPSSGFNDANPW